MRPAARGVKERGSATVVVVAVICVTVLITVAGLALASSAAAAHRARAAADLGSLAAAVAIQRGGSPKAACAAAHGIVVRNAGRPQGCWVDGDGSVRLTVTSRSTFSLPGLPREAVARARAGPGP